MVCQGAGKTTIGKMLSEKLNREFYDIYEEIENKLSKTISEVFEQYGEEIFRNIESEVIKEMSDKKSSVISLGGGAILREENMLNAKRNGKIVFINRPIEHIVKELKNDSEREKRPLLKDGIEKIYELYEQRIDLYKKYADIEVLNDSNLEQVVNKIIEVV